MSSGPLFHRLLILVLSPSSLSCLPQPSLVSPIPRTMVAFLPAWAVDASSVNAPLKGCRTTSCRLRGGSHACRHVRGSE